MRRRAAVLLLACAALCAALPARAQDAAAPLLAKLSGADPDLRTYTAQVAFDIGLRSFPYLRRTLHGNAYFKRPARMEVVLEDLPPIARAFSNVYVGLGTPGDWATKFTIGAAQAREGDRDVAYLVLTPRAARGRLRQVDVYVDDAASLPCRIVWHYRDGSIDMHQRFARVDGHDLIVAQDADIRLPAMHAVVAARISNYALNVDVDDRVFTKRASP